MNRLHSRVFGTVLLAVMAAAGCSEDQVTFSEEPPPPPPQRGMTAAATSDAGADAAEAQQAFREEDFVETDRSRDPFRSYTKQFVKEAKFDQKVQRNVVLQQYSLDELKLVGIVTGGTDPRAMVVDPRGIGWVIRRGQYIGRPELVRSTAGRGVEYELNWRVDRVREGDVVFVREDPAHSDVPPATRIIPLRTEPIGIELQ